MRTTIRSLATLSLLVGSNAAPTESSQGALKHWPPAAAKSLNKMIARNANQSNFAVFDADNTSWRYDIEESSLPYLENKGIITRDTLDPSLKLIEFKDTTDYTESLYSYYNRLCALDSMICYPWAAQVYSGLTIRELKGHIDDLMVLNSTIPVTYWDGEELVDEEINPPRIFTGQVELFNELMRNGIAVYVISASQEEVVRMVMSDPKYGYNVPAENVIGVATMLKNSTSGELTNARMQIEAGTYDEAANLDLVIGPYLWTPATWYAGKWAAVLTYIDMWKKPILAAGDTPGSDTYMHFNVDIEKGGAHLWINRSADKYEELQGLIQESVEGQEQNGLPVTADKNWIVVLPTDIQ
ncbi:uncharacterized protein BCR38DRAFT_352945 [Pseudomassariella vexata]|uniref:phosphoserine phosphatase n=1 Tax=Pseudomassariella vexata TaxID=1141098 RepID=A0A1Y2DHC7_9PEZI|nr:uncharacterized protein BCR38DRAFT_352945 [Pseudomassariella vexata]ORY58536.1 hypothetical protein BCR38DRAFT_352945 [Pseudomassariella vexata]